MSLPWFAFNYREYVSSTLRLTTLGHGAMIQFICHYWEFGRLPEGDEAKMTLIQVDEAKWLRIKQMLIQPFPYHWTPDWTNPTLDAARVQAEWWYRKRLERAQGAANRPDPIEWAVTRARIFDRDNYTCAYCGVRGGPLECDHKIPVCQGGTSEDDNLATSCKPCNRDKGGMTVEQWRAIR